MDNSLQLPEYAEPRDRINYVLEMTGLRLGELAAQLNISQATLSHIVSPNGRHSNISEKLADQILASFPELNLSKAWLLTGNENEEPEEQVTAANEKPANVQPGLFDNLIQAAPQSVTTQPATAVQTTTTNSQPVRQATTPHSSSTSSSSSSPSSLASTSTHSPAPAPAVTVKTRRPAATSPSTTTTVQQPEPQLAPSTPPASSHSAKSSTAPSPRVIERVIIFYSDGSFSDYHPLKN